MYAEKESCSWLNASLARLLFELFEMESFRSRIELIVRKRVVDMVSTVMIVWVC